MRKICKIHKKEVEFCFKTEETKVYYCPDCFGLIEEKDVKEVK